MIGILIGIVGASAAICGWIVGASFIYCRLSHHLDLFVFPFDQWLEIAPYWTINGWTKFCVVISAAGASAPFVAAVALLRRRLRTDQGGLFGKTGWATTGQMKSGGLNLKGKP
jgi:hypothetical protein